jgi:hypothetical protein
LEGVAATDPRIIGVALVAIHKIPHIDAAIALLAGTGGDRLFGPLFLLGGEIENRVPSPHQQGELVREVGHGL